MPTSLRVRDVTLNPVLVIAVPLVLATSDSRQLSTQVENPLGAPVERSTAPAMFPLKLRS